MKQSKYNIYFEREGKKYVYNILTSSLLELDESLYYNLRTDVLDVIPNNIMGELSNSSIIIDESVIEENIVLLKTMRLKYDTSSVRVTIMPTLDCNFHCWYCYENHHQSMMSEQDVQSVLAFCESLITGGIRHFHLDWFGGEPMLYFSEIMYPLAKRIIDLCKTNNISFSHSITTNGYLIDEKIISNIKEIKLNIFQITLDGGKHYHNRTRFTENDRNSFATITNNIITLCRAIDNVDMTVRINYTPHNLVSINEIVDLFPSDIRNKISISPQLVWQYKDTFNATTNRLRELLSLFKAKGYRPHINSLRACPCYAENMSQFVVNYDLRVYKCTARDFSQDYCVGEIKNGAFIPNAHYFNYVNSPDVQNTECRECKLLPICLGRCVQKRVEGGKMECNKDELLNSFINDITLYMDI